MRPLRSPLAPGVSCARARGRSARALLARAAAGALLLLGAPVAAAQAQQVAEAAEVRRASAAGAAPRGSIAAALAALPFGIGERLEYDAKVGPFKLGQGYMEVVALDTVRGQPALHLRMRVAGGPPGFRVRELLDSWIEPRTFSSLRHVQDLTEGRKTRARRYEIFPERGVYAAQDEAEEPTVRRPLDDGSFLYFVRTVPLLVGEVYEFDRYFRPDRNPVRIRVMRRERVKVPAGTFDAIVIQPVIKTKGLLSEAARTELWLTDDDRRILLKMESALPIGHLSLHLRTMVNTR